MNVAIYAKENTETKKRNFALEEKKARRSERNKTEMSEKSEVTDTNEIRSRYASSS
jgi:hypothetical protein